MEFPEYPYPKEQSLTDFMYKVYGWMSFALAITALVSYYVFKTEIYSYFKASVGLMILLIVLQFALVIALSAFIMRMSYATAVLMFMVYAVSVGMTLSFIFEVYTPGSIYSTFLVASFMFVATALYGYFTKADLTSMGSFAFMALIGIIIASLVNIFLRSPMFDLIISIVGVFVFVLLTAYDTQKLKELGRRLIAPQMRKKIAILGALTLYLDFINLFLFLLRLMGQQKEN